MMMHAAWRYGDRRCARHRRHTQHAPVLVYVRKIEVEGGGEKARRLEKERCVCATHNVASLSLDTRVGTVPTLLGAVERRRAPLPCADR